MSSVSSGCPFEKEVTCNKHVCERCARNPIVAQQRRKQTRAKLKNMKLPVREMWYIGSGASPEKMS